MRDWKPIPGHTSVTAFVCITQDTGLELQVFCILRERFLLLFFSTSKRDCFIYTVVLQAVKNYKPLLTSPYSAPVFSRLSFSASIEENERAHEITAQPAAVWPSLLSFPKLL